jgi:hypothetical protein
VHTARSAQTEKDVGVHFGYLTCDARIAFSPVLTGEVQVRMPLRNIKLEPGATSFEAKHGLVHASPS